MSSGSVSIAMALLSAMLVETSAMLVGTSAMLVDTSAMLVDTSAMLMEQSAMLSGAPGDVSQSGFTDFLFRRPLYVKTGTDSGSAATCIE